ncbi:MAG: ankyrin repeat domain-containing protein [Acidobacteria bacterium]|nr:ankyrin repeat domain-containing protein [Acidobacteriota bacterium]
MEQSGRDPKPKYIVPAAGQRGMTELHYAAYCNDLDDVRTQLSMGVPVDMRDDNGWTSLHWSIDMAQAWGEPEQVVSLLLKSGASANAVDNLGFSVLMMACGRNNEAIFEQLIAGGANIAARSSTGTTALHEAAGCNFTEAIRRLLELGADPHLNDEAGRTPKQIAEQCGFTESAEVLRGALS